MLALCSIRLALDRSTEMMKRVDHLKVDILCSHRLVKQTPSC
jgi:hypothetical protein